MDGLNITVTHKGTEYRAIPMTVTRTFLGYEDHGFLTFNLTCLSDDGGGIGLGNYSMDTPMRDADGAVTRIPTPYGMMMLIEVMRVVRADSWEEVTGKKVLALFEGDRCVGVADPMTGEAVVFAEFLENARERVAALEPAR